MIDTTEHLLPWLTELAERLKTQDNRCTAHPVYVVEQRKRITGMDLAYVDDVVWVGYEGEADAEEAKRLEEQWEDNGEEPGGWRRMGYVDIWERVQTFFTEQAAKDHIEANKHKLTDPRIFVDSAYRNTEWQKVEKLLREAPELLAAAERAEKAEKLAIKVRDLFMACCVCGIELQPGPAPHCEDGCDLDGDGECVPREEWKCEVKNADAEVDELVKERLARSRKT